MKNKYTAVFIDYLTITMGVCLYAITLAFCVLPYKLTSGGVAGIGTLIQLYPIWKIGSRLPIVMGISFTFVSIACVVGAKYGYGAVLGADEEKSRCFGFFFELRFGIYTSPRDI